TAALPARIIRNDAPEKFERRKARSSRSTRRLEQLERAEGTEGFSEELPIADSQHSTAEVRVAIIGHPNVGKSTLLNRLTGSDRSIVSPVPGTTRDAVDEIVRRDGKEFRFIDTAGIRRKGKTHLMAEKLSVVKIGRAHV